MADGRRSGPSLPDDADRPEEDVRESGATPTAGKRRREGAGAPEDPNDSTELDTSAPIDPLKVAASGLVHETPPRRRGQATHRSPAETTQPPQDPLALLAESIDSGERPAETPRRWFGRGRPDDSAAEHDRAAGTEPPEVDPPAVPPGMPVADAPADESDEAAAEVDQPGRLDLAAPLDPRPRGTFPRRGEPESTESHPDAVTDDWSFDELEATQWDADTQTAHAEAPAEESDQGQTEPDEVDMTTPDPTKAANTGDTTGDTTDGADPMDLLAEYTSSAASRPRDLGWSSRHSAEHAVSDGDAADSASAATESAEGSWPYRPSESAAPFESVPATPTEAPTEAPSETPIEASIEASMETSTATPADASAGTRDETSAGTTTDDTWSRRDDDLWPEPDRGDDDVDEEDDNLLRSWISRRRGRRQPAGAREEADAPARPEPEAPAAEPAPAASPADEPEPDVDEEQVASDAGWSAVDVPAVLTVEEPATGEQPSAGEDEPPAATDEHPAAGEEPAATVPDEATDAGGPPEGEEGAEETSAEADQPEADQPGADASGEDEEHTWTAEELAAEGWSTEDLTGAGWTTEQLAEIGWFEHLATAFGQARTDAPASLDEALTTDVVPADREEEQGPGETADSATPVVGAATEDVPTEEAPGAAAAVDHGLTEEEHHERHGLFGRRRRRRHDEQVVDEDVELTQETEQAGPDEQAADLDQAAEPGDAGTPSLDVATVLPTLTEWSDESSPEIAPAEVPAAVPADEAPVPEPEHEQPADEQPAGVEAPPVEDETAADDTAAEVTAANDTAADDTAGGGTTEPQPAAGTPVEETAASAAITPPEVETEPEADDTTKSSPADEPEAAAEVAEPTTMEETGAEPARETVEDTVGDTVVQTSERAADQTAEETEQPDEQPDEDHQPVQEPATEEASVSETEAQNRAAVPATRQPQPDDEFGLLDDFELYEDNEDFDLERPLAEQGLKPQPAAPAAAPEPEVTPADDLVETPPAVQEEAPAADAAEEAPAEETPAEDEAPKTTAPWAARGRGRKRGGATPAAAATAAGTTTPATTGSESGTTDSADTTTEGEEEESGEPPPAEPAPTDQMDAPTPGGSEDSTDASGGSSDPDDEPEEPEGEATTTVVGTEPVEVAATAPEAAPAAPVEDAADDADTGPPASADDVAPTADLTVAASSGTTTADEPEAAAAPVPDPFDQAVISEPTTEELRAWFEPAPQESAAEQPAEAAAVPIESTEVVEPGAEDDVAVDRPEISPVSRSWLYGREATTPVPAEEFAPQLPVADDDVRPGRRAARGTEPETPAPPPPSARAPGKRARRRAAAEAVHEDDYVDAMPSQVSTAFTSAMDESDEIPAFVEYRPTDFRRYALAVLFTITAVLAVLAIFYAVQEGSASSIITALSVTVLACAFWWGLLSWSPVIVSIARGTLEIAHGPSSQRFDLTDPDTQVSVGPNTHAREWTAEVARPGAAAVKIRASQVRAEQFSRIVAHYRREAERRRTPRLFA